ncbi:MAG: lactate utilization protein [Planctomycetaceae bacterium]|jgi:L-lactate utilization protein LutB|nr:lactate utilization protein [Planctomycetaceae bacterium]
MSDPAIEKRNELLGVHVVKALKSRHFEAFYYKTSREAVEKILSLLPKKESVSWGGSATLEEIGLLQRIRAEYDLALDRDRTTTIADRYEAMQRAFFCNNYLTSVNAISEDGQLVNVDGVGNRIAAMSFGPKRVIVVAGINKVVKTLNDALVRARTYASPINAQRLSNLKTPCTVTGVCDDCKSPDCICTYVVTTRISRPPGRIHVVLIGETLGF